MLQTMCEVNAGKVFRRLEKKYLISATQKKKLLKICGDNLENNKFFQSTICNLYYDTKDDDLIIKSIDKPEFKEKVRVRSYNIPTENDCIFFEIKTKHKEGKQKIGDKRRFQLCLKDYHDFLDGKASLAEIAERKIEKTNDVQIAREIDYMIKYLKLIPKIFIACERESYDGKKEKDLRVTFDANLRYRMDNLTFESGAEGKKFFHDKQNIILEIKASGGMPLWLVSALNELKIYPQSFSKYGKVYKQMKGKKNVQHYL